MLLHKIYDFERRNLVTPEEKRKLKELVITDNNSMQDIFNDYKITQDVEWLENQILSLIQPPKHDFIIIPTRNIEEDPEDSSPLGNFLRERKKTQDLNEPQSILHPQIVELDTEDNKPPQSPAKKRPSILLIQNTYQEDDQEDSSPMANFLRDRKKRLHNNHDHGEVIHPVKVDSPKSEPSPRSIIIPQRDITSDPEDSSPLGNFLRYQKMNHTQESFQSILKPQRIEEDS